MGDRLFSLLQFMGGTFPAGGFSHSCGLESYVAQGRVNDAATCGDFLSDYLGSVLLHQEGPAFAIAFSAKDTAQLTQLDAFVTASKTTKESRKSSLQLGRAFLRIAASILDLEDCRDYFSYVKSNAFLGNYCVVSAYTLKLLGVSVEDGLQSFLFQSLASLAQAGVKLIPMGQTDSQRLLRELCAETANVTKRILEDGDRSITNFSPALDIAAMHHERLYTRLYMS